MRCYGLKSFIRHIQRLRPGRTSRRSRNGGSPIACGCEVLESRALLTATVAITGVTVSEGPGAGQNAVFVVTRGGDDLESAFDVTFKTVDGTAVAGVDYVSQSGVVHFASGQTEAAVSISLLADAEIETQEDFAVELTGILRYSGDLGPRIELRDGGRFSFGVNTLEFSYGFNEVVADINLDGRPDIIAPVQSAVSVLLNTTTPGAADISFAPPALFLTAPRSELPNVKWVSVGDLNDDGRPDLVVVNHNSDKLSVFLNQTTPGAAVAAFSEPFNLPNNHLDGRAATITDLNGDGRPDLATVNDDTGEIAMYVNTTETGSMTASFVSVPAPSANGATFWIDSYDVNRDGRRDLILTQTDHSSIGILLNTTGPNEINPTFSPRQDFPLGDWVRTLDLADLNQDGVLDIFCKGNYPWSLVNTTPAGSDVATFSITKLPRPGADFGVGANIVDLNQDGRPDAALSSGDLDFYSVYRSFTELDALETVFDEPVTLSADHPQDPSAHVEPRCMPVGDFNLDGRPDLAVFLSQTNIDVPFISVLIAQNETPDGPLPRIVISRATGRIEDHSFEVTPGQSRVVAVSGSSAQISGSFTLPAGETFASLSTSLGSLTVNVSESTWSWNYLVPGEAPGNSVVVVTLTTATGLEVSASFAVQIVSEALVLDTDLAALTSAEGVVLSNSGMVGALDDLSSVTLTASVGTVTLDSTTGQWVWSLAETDGPDQFVVQIEAADSQGHTATTSFTVEITNAAPSLWISRSRLGVYAGRTVVNSGTFADAGGDPVTLSASTGILEMTGSGGWSWSLSTTVPTASRQSVTVTATDAEGSTSTVTFWYDVYAPSAVPEVTLSKTTVTYIENKLPVKLDSLAKVLDDDTLSYDDGILTVAISSGASEDDRLGIQTTGTGSTQIAVVGTDVAYGGVTIGSFSGGMGAIPLTVSLNHHATLTSVNALLRSVAFSNVSHSPATNSRTIQVQVDDGTGAVSAPVTRQISVVPVNDPPVVTFTSGTTVFTESTGPTTAANVVPVPIDPGMTVTDPDFPVSFEGGNLTVVTAVNANSGDRLAISPTGGISIVGASVFYTSNSVTNQIGSFSGGSGNKPLRIRFTNNTMATPEAVTALARAITFANITDNPGAGFRTIQFQVKDAANGLSSVVAARQITIVATPDAPVVTLGTGGTVYNENLPLVMAEVGRIVDADNPANFDGGHLTARIVSGGSVDDILGIQSPGASGLSTQTVNGVNQVLHTGLIIGTFTVSTGINATIDVALNANATVSRTQALLRALTFHVNSEDPTTASRTVQFQLSDGPTGAGLPGLTSVEQTRIIAVREANDAPAVTGVATDLTVAEGGAAAGLAPGATVTDADSPDFAGGSLTVSITSGAGASDRITIEDGDGITVSSTNILYNGVKFATFSSGGGVGASPLTITFVKSPAASIAAVQTLLRRIRFSVLTGGAAGARTLRTVLNDGDGGLTPASTSITNVSVLEGV